MPGDVPFAQLPDQVTLTRDEISVVLFALDVTESTELGEPERAAVRRAIRLITESCGRSLTTFSTTRARGNVGIDA